MRRVEPSWRASVSELPGAAPEAPRLPPRAERAVEQAAQPRRRGALRELWLVARLDVGESLRARWFAVYAGVFGGIVALLFVFGLTESRILGFMGLSRLLVTYIQLCMAILPVFVLVTTVRGGVPPGAAGDGGGRGLGGPAGHRGAVGALRPLRGAARVALGVLPRDRHGDLGGGAHDRRGAGRRLRRVARPPPFSSP